MVIDVVIVARRTIRTKKGAIGIESTVAARIDTKTTSEMTDDIIGMVTVDAVRAEAGAGAGHPRHRIDIVAGGKKMTDAG